MKYCFANEEVFKLVQAIKDSDEMGCAHLRGVTVEALFATGWKGDKAFWGSQSYALTGLLALALQDHLAAPGNAGTSSVLLQMTDPGDWTGFYIEINYDLWKHLKPEEEAAKKQIIHRALLRCQKDEKGALKIGRPDFSLFGNEVRIWGADHPELARVLELLKNQGQGDLFEEEQQETAPGSAPFSALGFPSLGASDLPALPAVGDGLPAIEARPVLIEGEIVEPDLMNRKSEDTGCDLVEYLRPLVLAEPPRKSTGESGPSMCTTLEQMLADLAELKADTKNSTRYGLVAQALRHGMGYLCTRQLTGHKSLWYLALNLANTINCDQAGDFVRAIELLPDFAEHMQAKATPKNPKNGLKSWNPARSTPYKDDGFYSLIWQAITNTAGDKEILLGVDLSLSDESLLNLISQHIGSFGGSSDPGAGWYREEHHGGNNPCIILRHCEEGQPREDCFKYDLRGDELLREVRVSIAHHQGKERKNNIEETSKEQEMATITNWPLERRVFANAAMAAGLDIYITKDSACPSFVETKRFAHLVLYGEPLYTGPVASALKDADLFFQAENALPMFAAHLADGGWPSKFKSTAKRNADKPLWLGSIAVKEQLRQSAEVLSQTSDEQLSDEQWEMSARSTGRSEASRRRSASLFGEVDIAPALSATQQAADFANQLAGGATSAAHGLRGELI